MRSVLIVRLLAGVAVAVAFFVAGNDLMRAGRFMDISSLGGQTLEEAFYQAYGLFAQALGIASMALGGLTLVVSIPTTWPPPSPRPTPRPVPTPAAAPLTSITRPLGGPTPTPSPATVATLSPAQPEDARSVARPAQCVRCSFAMPEDADFCPQCGLRHSRH